MCATFKVLNLSLNSSSGLQITLYYGLHFFTFVTSFLVLNNLCWQFKVSCNELYSIKSNGIINSLLQESLLRMTFQYYFVHDNNVGPNTLYIYNVRNIRGLKFIHNDVNSKPAI